MNLDEIKILDIKVNTLRKTDVLRLIKDKLFENRAEQYQIVTTNPEFILTAEKDLEFKKILNNSWLSVPDGYGIRLASKYLDLIKYKKNIILKFLIGIKIAWFGITRNNEKFDIIKEVITGADLVPEICKITNDEQRIINKNIFLLGGYGDTPKLVAEKLSSLVIPSEAEQSEAKPRNLLNFEYSVFEIENIIEKINLFKPIILFVAVGHPRAQKWIDENLSKMPSVKLAIGVGGAFDYISGKIKRAPESWRKKGFEWFYRLLQQPKRIKRIYTAIIKFPVAIFTAVNT